MRYSWLLFLCCGLQAQTLDRKIWLESYGAFGVDLAALVFDLHGVNLPYGAQAGTRVRYQGGRLGGYVGAKYRYRVDDGGTQNKIMPGAGLSFRTLGPTADGIQAILSLGAYSDRPRLNWSSEVEFIFPIRRGPFYIISGVSFEFDTMGVDTLLSARGGCGYSFYTAKTARH